MKRYSEYKDSGVEWIGEIPSHWGIKKLKYLSDIKTGDKDTQDSVEDGIYPFFVRSDNVEAINSYSFDGEAVLTAGDGVGVAKVFHYINGKFAYHQRVYKISDFKEIDGRYFYYYMKVNFGKEVQKLSAKTTVDSLRLPMFGNFPVVIPTDGGKQIVKYLDKKTSQIENLISKKEELIETLKASRTKLISETVTKGLDKDVPMKDSGVEWLGEIPSHWDCKVFKRIIKDIKDGTHGTHPRVDEGEYLLSAKNLNNNYIEINESDSRIPYKDYKQIVSNGFPKKRDILLSTVGSIGRSCVYEMEKPMAFQRSVTFIRLKNNNNPYFYRYFIESEVYQNQLNSYAKTSAQSGIYMGDILKTTVLSVPLDEQNNIVNYLNEQLERIDKIVQIIEEQIELLKKAKQKLITEVVTGKIDVTNL